MGIDERKHVLIKDRFEDALVELAATQSVVKELAASVSEDKHKIALLHGGLEGAIGQISKTQGAIDQLQVHAS